MEQTLRTNKKKDPPRSQIRGNNHTNDKRENGLKTYPCHQASLPEHLEDKKQK